MKVRATFFVLGVIVEEIGTKILERAYKEGHFIANHSFSHARLNELSEGKIDIEIKRTHELIAPFMRSERLFRPPYGISNTTVERVAEGNGYKMVFWDIDTLDWSPKYKPRKWISHGLEQVRGCSGRIILAHDNNLTTAKHLISFIRVTRDAGFDFCNSPIE